MEFFGKRFSSALLFGSMIFSTVNGVSVYGEESDTIVEQVAEELGDASNDVQDLSENDETREDKVVGSQNKSSGSKLGFGLASAAGGALIGVAAEETVKNLKKSPGSSGTSNSNEVETLKKDLNEARSKIDNSQSELKSSNKELDKLRSDLNKMKQGMGETSVLDAIGALSYIPGIGSDCKTDSGFNVGKLATVITMHVIGIICVAAILHLSKKLGGIKPFGYVAVVCDVICPPVGLVAHALSVLG